MTIHLEQLISFAGVVHLLIAAANFFLPAMLGYRENLALVSPIIRQIFIVHSIYIVLVLIGFSSLCFFFPGELAGESPLGRSISGFLALFWLLRIGIQASYYDRAVKRRNRSGNAIFLLAFLYLAGVFGFAAVFPK